MSSGFPPLTALLGLRAIAGHQNRHKIAGRLKKSGPSGQGGVGGILGGLAGDARSAGGKLERRARRTSRSLPPKETASSWMKTGPNKPVTPSQLEQAIGPDILNSLVQQTGLRREKLLARLSREPPEAVDKYNPQGRIPSAEFSCA